MLSPKLIVGLAVLLPCLLSGNSLLTQDAETDPDRKSPEASMPLKELAPDRKIPSLDQVLAHAWGKDVSSHGEVERYLRELVRAAPFRSRLKKYGTSYEGRALLPGHIIRGQHRETRTNSRKQSAAERSSPGRAGRCGEAHQGTARHRLAELQRPRG